MKPKSELILYQTEDNRTRIEVRLENETVWLSLNQMAELFQTTKQNVSLHIQNIYAEGELRREATVKEYLTVQKEGSREVSRSLEHYNLDVIISVGYRVKSHRGTQFRIWAAVLVHGNGVAFEVEFVGYDGHTVALLTLERSQVRSLHTHDIPHARELQAAR